MTSRWSRHISTSLQDQCTTSKIFGVSRKEDRFTGLWKTAQTSELLRQISTSVPDLHSVSSQSQQREEMKAGLWRLHRRVNAELALTDTEQINWLEEQHKSIMFHIMSSHLTSVSFSWIFESNDPPAIVKQILLVYETSIQASWMSGVSRDMDKKARVWWSERVSRQSWTLRASRQVTVISSKTRTVSRAVLHYFGPFPPPRVSWVPRHPLSLPWLSTLQISQLHCINLLCLIFLCAVVTKPPYSY